MPGFSGQGIVSIAERLPSGLPGVFRELGNCPSFELGLTEETVERTESMSGQRLPFRKMTRTRGGTLTLQTDEFNKANLALAVVGSVTQVAAGTPVTNWALPTDLQVGDIVALPALNVAANTLTITDSTSGTAVDLVLDTHYSYDPLSAEIKILSLAGITQPLTADFTPGGHVAVGAFQAASKEYWVRLKGINTDTSERGVTDIFRCKINPATALALINEDFLDFDMELTVLADLTRETDDPGGQFFRFATAA